MALEVSVAAVSMAVSPILSQLVSRSAELISKDRGLSKRKRIYKDLDDLRSTLLGIEEILADADRKQIKSPAALQWLRRLRDSLYTADDLLDECAMGDVGGAAEGAFSSPSKLKDLVHTYSCHKVSSGNSPLVIARRVRDVKEELDRLLASGDRFGFTKLLGPTREVRHADYRKPETSLLDRNFHVLGRDDLKEEMIELLTAASDGQSGSNFRVLPVVGMGGIGKTAIVRHVFHDPTVDNHFQLKGWVWVSTVFNMEILYKEIIQSFTGQTSNLGGLEGLQTELVQAVQSKRFLLILDDVWSKDKDKWEELLKPFSLADEGSALVITTRNEDVAKAITKGRMEKILLGGLEDEIIWEIVKQHAFSCSVADEYDNLHKIAEVIVKKLNGSPLAAKAIGRLLGMNLDEQSWKKIRDSVLWETLFSGNENELSPALVLSYLHLPPEAKSCFLHCSLFPNGSSIKEHEFIYQWTAHDFIQAQGETSLEDAGKSIIKNFESMSLLQHDSDPDYGFNQWSSLYYEMHDLINEMAQNLAKDDHLQISSDRAVDTLASSNLRHVSICKKLSPETLMSLKNCAKLRTLLFNSIHGNEVDASCLQRWFRKLKHLRVLGLEGCQIEKLPSSICNLKHLRYLDLAYAPITKLPKTLNMLYNLQFLRLFKCIHLKVLPKAMEGLKSVRYLDLSYTQIVEIPASLTKLCNLRELRLYRCRKLKELPIGMGNLKHMQCLNLAKTFITELPKSLTMLSDLRELNLTDCYMLRELPNKWVGNLSKLRYLFASEELVSAIKGIGRLTSLENLDKFSVGKSEGHMIEELKNLNMLHHKLSVENLEHIRDLKEAEQARLHQKRHLQQLVLQWSISTNKIDFSGIQDTGVLEGLRPNAYLERLTIKHYLGSRYPSWLNGQLSKVLKNLSLVGLKHMEKVTFYEKDDEFVFPSLEVLEFHYLTELKYWTGGDHDRFLPRLRELRIEMCPKLISIPPFPLTLQKLMLSEVGIVVLPRFCCAFPQSTSAAGVSSLSNKSSSLAYLYINRCQNLRSLVDSILDSHLPSLNVLKISHCQDLEYLRARNLMGSISLEDCPKLSRLCLPDTSNLLSSIQELEIMECSSLDLEWVKKYLEGLTSLERLVVNNCFNKMSSSFLKDAVLPHLQNLSWCRAECYNPNLLIEKQNQEYHDPKKCIIEISCIAEEEEQEGTEESCNRQKLFVEILKQIGPSSIMALTVAKPIPRVTWKERLVTRTRPQLMSTLLLTWLSHLESVSDGNENMAEVITDSSHLADVIVRSSVNLLSVVTDSSGYSSLKYLVFDGSTALLLEDMRGLTSLESVCIIECDSLFCLPENMRGPSTLKDLSIWSCNNIRSLPEDMSGLSSIRRLCIDNCENFHLPESSSANYENLCSFLACTKGLSSLNSLFIKNCKNVSIR